MKFSTLYGPSSSSVLMTTRHLPQLLNQTISDHAIPPYFLKVNFNIINSWLGLPTGLLPSNFPTVKHHIFSSLTRATCPSYHILFDLIRRIIMISENHEVLHYVIFDSLLLLRHCKAQIKINIPHQHGSQLEAHKTEEPGSYR